ncbi:MAG TPA: hypothetical protein VND65_20405 [Candidatus Binatia bacterium]|nr:hypothetical protein [Candidatus Binatia bacterium]
MTNDALEQRLKALDSFKDWSNYLLITTVAALGWTTGKDAAAFCTPCMKTLAILTFALSIVFAILVLALIPHVAEGLRAQTAPHEPPLPSIYEVRWKHWLVNARLTSFCLPQHVLFLVGIVLYAVGSTFTPPSSWCILGGALAGTTVLILVFGNVI